jgi:iron complex transport system substrate-binding protein
VSRPTVHRRLLLGCALALGAGAATRPAFAERRRIVSVGGAVTEIIYALDAQDLLVGVDTTSLYPEAARSLPQVGYMRALSAEGVLSLRPTTVIATTAAGPKEVLDQLRSAGIEIVVLPDHYDYDSVVLKMEEVGRLTGRSEAARTLIADGRREMSRLTEKLAALPKRPRVLFLLSMGGGAPQAAGQNTAADGIIKLAGGTNAAQGYAGYRPLTPESVLASRPDIVLVTNQTVNALGGVDKIRNQPSLSQTPAGKDGRILAFDALLLLGFGPRTPKAATDLAAALHPELAAKQ